MAAWVEGISRAQSGLLSQAGESEFAGVRIVVGVTSDQTCLVLGGRLHALREAGFAVTLVASPGELLERTAQTEGVFAWPVAMRRRMAPIADLRSFVALCFMLWRVRPAITDFSTPKAGLLGNLAAWMMRVPTRVYTLRGLKLESSSGLKRGLLLWSERVAARCAHVVLCNSESLRAEAIALNVAPARKLRMLGEGSSNGVDTKRFSPASSAGESTVRRELGIPAGDIVLGFVGRLTRDKGVPELLVAFDEILREEPAVWLLLAGWFDQAEDALDRRWRERIAGHPRIRHVGYVADAAEYYRAMDLFVLPTHREGFPNAVLEASASGLPVITTRSTGARDAVVAEVTGLLIPAGVPEAIVEASLELIRDGAKRRRMGAAGWAWAVERYSRTKVLGLAVEFYRGLVSDGGHLDLLGKKEITNNR
jgi:glycosyltransferase involved in cell wall biosynthesis